MPGLQSVEPVIIEFVSPATRLRSSALAAAALVLAAAAPAAALDPKLEDLMEEGETRLYNLEFDRAVEVFARACREYPRHPAGYSMRGAAVWWQARYWYRVPDGPASREMNRDLDRAIELARKLADDPATACEGQFFLGAALGVQAHWKLLTGSRFGSVLAARSAVRILKAMSSCTPLGDEACFGLGMYEYVSSQLPWHHRWASKLIIGGGADREAGIAKLARAARAARFVRHDAQFSLSMLLTLNQPSEPARALEYALQIVGERPESPLARALHAQTLVYLGRFDEALRVADGSLAAGREPDSPFARETATMRYYRGIALLGLQRLPEAIQSFTEATDQEGPPAWITGAYLMRGCAHDLKGDRERALADYRAARQREDPWEQVKRAEPFLHRPYTWDDFAEQFPAHPR